MKKVLLILAIAGTFVACNSTNTTEETTSDTSVSLVPQEPDTLKTVTDTTIKTTESVDHGASHEVTTDTLH